jgi:hypothetical protein
MILKSRSMCMPRKTNWISPACAQPVGWWAMRKARRTPQRVAHPTTEFMKFIAEHNISFENAAAARQHDGGDHNRRETPLFAASIERKALGRAQQDRRSAGAA